MSGLKESSRAGVRASLTVEAAFCLTLFLFTVILLSVPIEILDTQRKIQMTLESASRELSQLAYISYRRGLGDEDEQLTKSAESSELAGLLTGASLQVYLTGKIGAAAGNKIDNIDCTKSRITEDGEFIDLRASYHFKLPFSVFLLDSIHLSSRSFRRGWIGKEPGSGTGGGREGEVTMVYIGQGSVRYHMSSSCHYLSNEITSVSFDALDEYRNKNGSRYRSCSVCGKSTGSGQMVYILPSGESYHSRADCSSLISYVKKVPLSQVEHLGVCSYCGGGK